MAKIIIEKDLCIGCGACAATESSVFEIQDDGLAAVKKDVVNDDVLMAVDSCPTGAIAIKDCDCENCECKNK